VDSTTDRDDNKKKKSWDYVFRAGADRSAVGDCALSCLSDYQWHVDVRGGRRFCRGRGGKHLSAISSRPGAYREIVERWGSHL